MRTGPLSARAARRRLLSLMVKYLLGILSGVVLVFLLIGAVFLMAVTMGGAPPSIEDDSVLVIRLRGPIPEHVGVAFSFGAWDSSRPSTVLESAPGFSKGGRGRPHPSRSSLLRRAASRLGQGAGDPLGDRRF